MQFVVDAILLLDFDGKSAFLCVQMIIGVPLLKLSYTTLVPFSLFFAINTCCMQLFNYNILQEL